MSSAAAELIEVPLSDRKLVDRFIRVPWYVNREHHPSAHWVAPLLMDRRDYLNPTKNPFFEHVQAAFWVATVNGASVVSQKWGYLLASESVIAAASSWSALKTAAQAFA